MKQFYSITKEKSKYFKLVFRIFILVFISCTGVFAQSTINTAIAPITNNNGSGTVTFNFQNTNPYGIIITDIEGIVGTAGLTSADLWIKTTPVSAAPGAISVANGWTLAATGTFTGVANTTTLVTQPMLTGISVVIPAGVTYGFAISAYSGTAGRQRYHTILVTDPTTFSAGGCNILMGANISYAGGAPPTAPTNTPRGWMGKLTFIPQAPCVDPPTPGTAITTPSTQICPNSALTLDLTGNSGGLGQTYQWQTGPTASGPWTNIGSSSGAPSLIINPTASAYYQCLVTCGLTTLPSTAVFNDVATLFPGGTYTINSALPTGGGNYASFNDAVAAIQCGIAGPVIFNFAPGSGPYVEQVIIPQIGGTSTTNTITFNGNGVSMIAASANTNQREAILLNGADHITIDSILIDVSGGTYGWESG
ncbi:MAG: hypothetical protein IPJ86_16315 [Bacteroidetes bacterium]|nr:hypothetical protein [Bacteroidota bacterium]